MPLNIDRTYDLYEPIHNDLLVTKLLEFPRKGFTDNWIINAFIDFGRDILDCKTQEVYARKFNTIEEVLKEMYGEENFEIRIIEGLYIEIEDDKIINLRIQKFTRRCIILFFDKIKIRNSKGYSHNIFELYVRIDFFNNYNLDNEIQLARTFYTDIELKEGYIHSHCRCSAYEDEVIFKEYCLGSGPLSTAFTNMEMTKSDYILFFFDINRTIEWESVEGVPYFYIQDLIPNKKEYQESDSIAYKSISKSITDKLYQLIPRLSMGGLLSEIITQDESYESLLNSCYYNSVSEIYNYILEHKINNILVRDGNYVRVKMTDELHEIFVNIGSKYSYSSYLYNNEAYYKDLSTEDKVEKYNQDTFKFKGKYPQITKVYITKNTIKQYYDNQTIKYIEGANRRLAPGTWQDIRQQLEEFINIQIISRDKDEKGRKLINYPKIMGETSISLSKYS